MTDEDDDFLARMAARRRKSMLRNLWLGAGIVAVLVSSGAYLCWRCARVLDRVADKIARAREVASSARSELDRLGHGGEHHLCQLPGDLASELVVVDASG